MAKNDKKNFSTELLDHLLAERMLNAEMDVLLANEAETGVATYRKT